MNAAIILFIDEKRGSFLGKETARIASPRRLATFENEKSVYLKDSESRKSG